MPSKFPLKISKTAPGLTWPKRRAEGFGRFVYFSLYLTLHYTLQATPSEYRNLSPASGTFPYTQKHSTDEKN